MPSEKSGGGISWSIYGATFDEKFRVKHERAIDLDGVLKFCGSKYVQSELGRVYDDVASDLNCGMYVLFTGTPCQIAALKAYLHKKEVSTDKLITVDIVCHGTPQIQFWEDWVHYLEEKENSKLKNFSFRYKPKG